MTVASLPQPPDHLSAASAQWWRSVVGEYRLQAHHLKLLVLACEAMDRAVQARQILDAEGVVVLNDRRVPIAHPAIKIENDARNAFMPECPDVVQSLLGLDIDGLRGEAQNVLVQIAASMRRHGRGGALLVVPAGSTTWRARS